MTPDGTRKLLDMIGAKVPHHQPRAGWVISDCPMGPWSHVGGKSSAEVFGVRLEPGDARCNCFSCGFHGKLSDLILEMRVKNKTHHAVDVKWGQALGMIEEAILNEDIDLDTPDIGEVLLAEKADLHVFPEWWLETFPLAKEAPAAVTYLAEREVPVSVQETLDLRFDPQEKRVCFPVRDFKGRLVGLHGRALKKDTEPRYRMYSFAKQNNPIVWLGEQWVDTTQPIVVVEGPFDLASVRRVYANVVSPLFVNPSVAKIKRMADALEVVTFFDIGVGGDQGRAKFEHLLGSDHYVTHVKPPKGVKDPGECSVDQLMEALSPHVNVSKNPCN